MPSPSCASPALSLLRLFGCLSLCVCSPHSSHLSAILSSKTFNFRISKCNSRNWLHSWVCARWQNVCRFSSLFRIGNLILFASFDTNLSQFGGFHDFNQCFACSSCSAVSNSAINPPSCLASLNLPCCSCAVAFISLQFVSCFLLATFASSFVSFLCRT